MKEKKKLYISGPITGTDGYMEKFEKAQAYLEGLGYSTINPAKVNGALPEDTTYQEYMNMSMTMLAMADGVYMLTGWQQSKGATQEHTWAVTMGLAIIQQESEELEQEKEKIIESLEAVKETLIHQKQITEDGGAAIVRALTYIVKNLPGIHKAHININLPNNKERRE